MQAAFVMSQSRLRLTYAREETALGRLSQRTYIKQKSNSTRGAHVRHFSTYKDVCSSTLYLINNYIEGLDVYI